MNLPASRWLQHAFIRGSNLLHGKIICSLDSNKNNSNKQGLIRRWQYTVYRERTGRTVESTILEQEGVQNKEDHRASTSEGQGSF